MKILEPYKSIHDKRGLFLGIVNSAHWEEINYIETFAGEVRGGHYHTETRELFFIIEGEVEITIQSVDRNETRNVLVMKGSIFVVEPGEVHTFSCKTACKWINVLSKRIDDQFYDFHLPKIGSETV